MHPWRAARRSGIEGDWAAIGHNRPFGTSSQIVDNQRMFDWDAR
jgi:hypothetical protein